MTCRGVPTAITSRLRHTSEGRCAAIPFRSWVVSTIARPSWCRSWIRCITSCRVRTSTPDGRLVQQQQLRTTKHRARDEHPLLLPAGQLSDVAFAEAAETETLEDLVGFACARPATPRAPRDPAIRAIRTASRTVMGKYQLTVSTCGT